MGQEASMPVPAADGTYDEGTLAAAAAAGVTLPPPSAAAAVAPNSTGNGSGLNHHHQHGAGLSPNNSSHNNTHAPGGRSSRKLMAAMFQRGGNQSYQQQQQQQQQQAPPDSDEQREVARAMATAGNIYLPDESNSPNGSEAFSVPPQQQQQYAVNHYSMGSAGEAGNNHMLDQQQQYYYQQQQAAMYEQASYDAALQQQQLSGYSTNPSDVMPSSSLSSGSGSNHGGTAGIMYDKHGAAGSSKKSLFPARAQARGAALIHSMRNLSLGGALGSRVGVVGKIGRSSQQPRHAQQRGHAHQQQPGVNDWEKQWDEDDDDSEEDEVDESAKVHQQQHARQAAVYNAELHDADRIMVPDLLQGGTSSISMASTMPLYTTAAPSSPPSRAAMLPQDLLSLEAQQLAPPSMMMPTSLLQPTAQHQLSASVQPYPHSAIAQNLLPQQQQQVMNPFLSAPTPYPTPTTSSILVPPGVASVTTTTAVTPPTSPRRDDAVDAAGVSSTLDWDTTVATAMETEKPNVQMFMPMLRVLGKGSFGKVVLVQKNGGKERGALFAMKILRKTHLVKRRQIERTRTERKVLSVVNHPFIMRLHYAFQTHDKLYLVLDYCPGGELFFHLSRFRRFPERVARFYAAELLLAIGHLHKRGIIYRDLKPENVLLDADGHLKLGDFGLAKAGIQHPCEGATSMCGTPEYMAPEVLSQQGHGFCVDYWGLGMIVYEMMTGLPPWYTTDRAKLFRRLKSAPLDVPSYFTPVATHFVSALLERNPRRRLGATGIRAAMEHEFFKNISWRSLYARRVEAPIQPCEGWKPPESVEENFAGGGVTLPMNGMATARVNGGVEKLGSHELEAATANFDSSFLRMPIESEEPGQGGGEGDDNQNQSMEDYAGQLDEHTFRGFSFDCREPQNFHREMEAHQQQHLHQHQQYAQQQQRSPTRQPAGEATHRSLLMPPVVAGPPPIYNPSLADAAAATDGAPLSYHPHPPPSSYSNASAAHHTID